MSLVPSLALVFGLLCCGSFAPAAQQAVSPFSASQQVRNGGSYLGVGLVDINRERAAALSLDSERGTEVMKVLNGSPAEKAGLRPQDVLLTYNGEAILGAQQLGRLVWETPEGRQVKVTYWRDGKERSTTVVTAKTPFPSFDAPPQTSGPVERFHSARMMDIPTPMLIWKNSPLGIECEAVDSQLAEYFGVNRGVLVRFVDEGSRAEKVGLHAGDVLLAADNHPLAGPRDLGQVIGTQAPNAAVHLSLVRDHKRMTVTLPPSQDPQ